MTTYFAGQSLNLGGAFQLNPGEVRRIRCDSQILRVKAGCAWVSIGREDFILQRDDELMLEPSANGALISALRKIPLEYELIDLRDILRLR